jgi:hypothetical protein
MPAHAPDVVFLPHADADAWALAAADDVAHALRDALAARGRDRAAAFSWSASARAHIEAYTLAQDA